MSQRDSIDSMQIGHEEVDFLRPILRTWLNRSAIEHIYKGMSNHFLLWSKNWASEALDFHQGIEELSMLP
jgi:hypothetical protein